MWVMGGGVFGYQSQSLKNLNLKSDFLLFWGVSCVKIIYAASVWRLRNVRVRRAISISRVF